MKKLKPKKCKNALCEKSFMPTRPFQVVCDPLCAVQYVSHASTRKRIENIKKRADKKVKKDFNINNYRHQFKLTRLAAQKLANRLDAELPCICCGALRGTAQFCGGHAKTQKAHPELALDLHNIHGQRNAFCNKHKSGNWSGDKHSWGYEQGLILRYGQGMVDYLETFRVKVQYTPQDLIQLRKVYAKEIRLLEAGQPPSRNWRSLEAL